MRSGLKTWNLWGVPLFTGVKREIYNLQSTIYNRKGPFWIATVNPEHVMKAVEDKSYLELLNKTDINVMDGIGLIWAKLTLCPNFQFSIFNFQFKKLTRLWFGFKTGVEILAGKHRERLMAGSGLMKEMVEEAGKTGKKVFLLGGWGDRAARAARNLQSSIFNLHSEFRIETCAGEPEVKNEEVIKKINKFQPDYLFVAYGMKKQEEWILENRDKLKAGVVMGVGRSFDYYSGDLKMAPRWVRKMGFEWLYSLIQEPKRWRRQLALVRFVGRVIGGI